MHLDCPLVSSENPETLSYSENVKKFEPRSRKIERTQETEAKFEFWQRKIFEKAANFVQFSSVRQLQFKELGKSLLPLYRKRFISILITNFHFVDKSLANDNRDSILSYELEEKA